CKRDFSVGLSAYNILVRILVFAFLLLGLSCSGPAPESKSGPVVPSHEPPKDLATKFPLAGQVKMQLVPDHILGKDFMPGGNLADYKTEAGEYQVFLMEFPDVKAAAFKLLDWKTAIPDAKYLSSMG